MNYSEEYDKIIRNSSGILCDNQNGRIEMPTNNGAWSKSHYYLSGGTYLHFTNLKALFSIIHEKKIRLYDLNNPIDTNEFNYGAEHCLEYKTNPSLKTGTFFLSLTKEENKQSIKFWNNYTDNFNGCCIVFEILSKNIDSWINFHLSSVLYNTTIIEELSKARQALISTHNLSINFDIGNKLYQIFYFHKKHEFKWEDEIRLIAFDIHYSGKDYCFSSKKIVKYISLPLELSDTIIESDGINEKPIIRIKEIIFGLNISPQNKIFIKEYITTNIDHKHLIKYFEFNLQNFDENKSLSQILKNNETKNLH